MYNGWYYAEPTFRLTEEEKEFNASKAMTILRQNNFTIYAAAGVVGNMWAESGMNPGQWEGDNPYHGGYGLVQWTPWSDYWPWPAGSTDWLNNGPREMERLIYERDNNLEFWHNTTTMPGWSWSRFCALVPEQGQTINSTINLAAEVFVYRYLAPSDPAGSLANRQYHARYVYQHCPGSVIPPWLLFKWSKLNRRIYT